DAGRLDDHQAPFPVDARDIAPGEGDEAVFRQVQIGLPDEFSQMFEHGCTPLRQRFRPAQRRPGNFVLYCTRFAAAFPPPGAGILIISGYFCSKKRGARLFSGRATRIMGTKSGAPPGMQGGSLWHKSSSTATGPPAPSTRISTGSLPSTWAAASTAG